MKIRRATLEDLSWIMEQLKDFIDFAGYSSIYDPEYLPQFAADVIQKHFVIVAVDGDSRLGMLAAVFQPHPFNPKKTLLSELCWWVPKNHRKSVAGLALLTTYMEWGKKHADYVALCSMANSPLNPTSLERRGFKMKEQVYLWEKS